MPISRRRFNAAFAAAASSLIVPRELLAQPTTTRVPDGAWLLFTKSSGFEHDVVKRRDDGPNLLARAIAPIFGDRPMIATKDGRHFEPDRIGRFAGFIFYTSGDLTQTGTDRQPPMSTAGKAALLQAVEQGTPFIGLHCATDSFRQPVDGKPDPYTQMIGGRFESHGDQQRAAVSIADASFPGAHLGQPDDFELNEEWYAFDYVGEDVKAIHTLQTAGMKGDMYARQPYPITWTRTHGKGRVFYTALGHREDVINSERFKRLIGGAIDWCEGRSA